VRVWRQHDVIQLTTNQRAALRHCDHWSDYTNTNDQPGVMNILHCCLDSRVNRPSCSGKQNYYYCAYCCYVTYWSIRCLTSVHKKMRSGRPKMYIEHVCCLNCSILSNYICLFCQSGLVFPCSIYISYMFVVLVVLFCPTNMILWDCNW